MGTDEAAHTALDVILPPGHTLVGKVHIRIKYLTAHGNQIGLSLADVAIRLFRAIDPPHHIEEHTLGVPLDLPGVTDVDEMGVVLLASVAVAGVV